MRVVHVTGAKGPFELVKREIPEPGPGSVRVKVEACGICHSDVLDGLSAVEAAPLMCAGVTTFNALRNSGASTR